jgi:beta-lactamase class A
MSGCNHHSDNLIIQILKSESEKFDQIHDSPEKYKLQILYTQIDRDSLKRLQFKSYSYNLNTIRYFYPASTVKLPAAILALEKLNNLNISGLNKYTSLKIDSAYSEQSTVRYDSTSGSNLPSIANYIKKIFLVSDNDAFNRLYEFLGQQYLTETFREKGYTQTKIIRRLETGMTPEENRATNPFTFYNAEKILYQQPLIVNPNHYIIEMQDVRQGRGYYKNDSLINEPINFSYSNYISIENLQGFIKAIFFPEIISTDQRFNLTQDDYEFLYKYMSMYPRQSEFTLYLDTTKFYDSYVKLFMFGDSNQNIPDNIRIFNKTGRAYGYVLDNAYIIDLENRIEFLLTAVIQVNENQIYNDDTYEYDEIGVPFMANLGRSIYNYELKRDRKHRPDLSKLKINE